MSHSDGGGDDASGNNGGDECDTASGSGGVVMV